jgi:hypothetical protein
MSSCAAAAKLMMSMVATPWWSLPCSALPFWWLKCGTCLWAIPLTDFQITSLVKTVALFVLAYLLTACARSILSVPGLSDEQQFRIEFPWLRIQDLHYQGRHPVFFWPAMSGLYRIDAK